MDKIELILACMNKKSTDFIIDMNVNMDCVIANQGSNDSILRIDSNSHHITMINTSDRGVGKNRNIGLLFSKNEILFFGDEDIVYYDGCEKIIANAFKRIPDADVIIFNADTNNLSLPRYYIKTITRINKLNYMKYGTYRIAIRNSSLKKANIHFSELFGGGCIYGSGEDTLFLLDCLKKKLRIYGFPATLGITNDTVSCWFNGYNNKYFYDKGALLKCGYPKSYILYILYFLIKFRGKSEIKMRDCRKLLFAGAKNFKSLIPFCQYKEIENERNC